MKTAVSIPDALFAEAEAAAKRQGVSRSKLVQTALQEFLNRERSRNITDRLNASLAANPEPADPFLDAIARETLLAVEWDDEAGRNLVGKRRSAKRVRARVPAAGRHRVGK